MSNQAKFDYYDPAALVGVKPDVGLTQLAVNVVTDWMPGVPNSLAEGFTALLGQMLSSENIDGEDLWAINPIMTGFEKQWRQVTSWILGVAFCRKVIEDMGYRWWAPVSAFNSTRRTTITPYWTLEFPTSDSVVERVGTSLLFPDYVLARVQPGGTGYQLSFAESKGCADSLVSLTTPPSDWKNQSTNARFIFRGTPLTITQFLLIATRVQPRGKRTRTRRIQVRAWNSRQPEAEVSFQACREIVISHYFGVCERIGLRANSQLLALRNYQNLKDEERRRLLIVSERLSGTAHDELLGEESNYINSVSRRATIRVGQVEIRIGLSAPAIKLIRGLQQPAQRDDSTLFRTFEEEMVRLQARLQTVENVFIRSDGVVGELLTEGRSMA